MNTKGLRRLLKLGFVVLEESTTEVTLQKGIIKIYIDKEIQKYSFNEDVGKVPSEVHLAINYYLESLEES